MTFCPSCGRQRCMKKYDELKLINHVQTSEILLIEKFTYKVFIVNFLDMKAVKELYKRHIYIDRIWR